MKIGYGRVSTRDQNPDAQRDALAAARCDQVFIDKASGKLARRPELDRALLVARAGDQLVVTKLDRLGRSLEHLIDLSKGLQGRDVNLVVLAQGIDTSTAVGRMFFQILGAIAEFEHALMSERTMDGLAAARARGRTGGQKPKLTPRQARIAQEMYDETRPGRQASLRRGADRRRVRRHPSHYLPSPRIPGIDLNGDLPTLAARKRTSDSEAESPAPVSHLVGLQRVKHLPGQHKLSPRRRIFTR
jgi:DNA invertase Pin-like site-specific DNA recombinase